MNYVPLFKLSITYKEDQNRQNKKLNYILLEDDGALLKYIQAENI